MFAAGRLDNDICLLPAPSSLSLKFTPEHENQRVFDTTELLSLKTIREG